MGVKQELRILGDQTLARAMFHAFRTIGRVIHARAVQNLTGRVLHRRSGRLVHGLQTRVTQEVDGATLVISNPVFYGAAWEEGFYRRAYEVEARTKLSLRWIDKSLGIPMFALKVSIPAQYFPAKPWLQPAVDDSEQQIIFTLAKHIDRAFPEHKRVEIVLRINT